MYDPDSRFTMEALSRLEANGIPVLSSQNINMRSFRHFLGLSEMTIHALDSLASILNTWLSGFSNVPPTWNNLFLVIHQLNVSNLVQQIETYLSVGTVKEPSKMRESEAAMVGEGERIR